MRGFEVFIYPSVLVAADGFCTALSPTAKTSPSARGITGLVKMNTTDLLINYTDHHGCVLITERVFSVLGSSFRIIQRRNSLWPYRGFNIFVIRFLTAFIVHCWSQYFPKILSSRLHKAFNYVMGIIHFYFISLFQLLMLHMLNDQNSPILYNVKSKSKT